MSNDLKLYGFDGCPYCQELKELLDKDNIIYEYIDIDDDKNHEHCKKMFEIADSEKVPMFVIGKKIFVPEKSFSTIPEGVELIKRFLSK